jgi:hypothetical protein
MQAPKSLSFFGDSEAQAVLERIKVALGVNFNTTDVFPWSVVSEAVMSNNITNYVLPINVKNQSNTTALPNQQGLLDSDLFIGYKIALTVDSRNTGSPSSVVRWQFGNSSVFTGSGATQFGVANDIETFYNAQFSLTVSTTAKIQSMFTNEFRQAGNPATAIAVGPLTASAWSNDLKYVHTPIVTLYGADQNNYNIQLSTGTNALAIQPGATEVAAGYINVVSVLHKGFRIPQGTNAYRALVDASRA